jgi:protein-tyrosine phosphatase
MSFRLSVLFVCLGNICRSPACEGICKYFGGDKLIVDSCGTIGFHSGEHPDRRSISACKAKNINIESHQARRISEADWNNFELIVALDKSIEKSLQIMKPIHSKAKIVLFNSPNGIDDPFYGTQSDFDQMVEDIFRIMPIFLKENRFIEEADPYQQL